MSTTALLLWVASICASISIASVKAFNRYLAFALGLFLGPIGVLIVILEPPGVKTNTPKQ